jgi:phthiodiolone/phenolphthiodiolone dimycocerosates ketoreductase
MTRPYDRLQIGMVAPYFPPAELVRTAGRLYEAAGFDFMLWGDQLNLTIPRSIWTPDIVPAAGGGFDIDCWMDPFACATAVAGVTERIELMLICDALRRTPPNLAQQAMTVDQFSGGRFLMAMGAGEYKQFAPYGLARSKPFGHLEEAIRIIKLFFARDEPVSYDGPIWSLRNAIVRLDPFDREHPPAILVAGGPGRAIEIAGRHADGWLTYVPPAGDVEWYAATVKALRAEAERAGRDPEALILSIGCSSIIVEDESQLDEVCANPALRWDAACVLPSGAEWHRWGATNPLGDDWHYMRDFVPMDWSREDTLAICEQVPVEVVKQSKFSGTPARVASLMKDYVDAGANHVFVGNYAALITSGDFGDAAAGVTLTMETCRLLRQALQPL